MFQVTMPMITWSRLRIGSSAGFVASSLCTLRIDKERPILSNSRVFSSSS
jgi:hypothetical protein